MSQWPVKKLGELYQIARGGSPRPIKSYITTDSDGINWIKIGDTVHGSKYIYETKEKIKPSGLKKSRFVEEGDFILSNSMSFGRPYIMKTSGCIHDGWLVLKSKEDLLDQDFAFHLLSSPTVFKQFDNLAAGSTVRNLNSDLVRGVTVPVPPLPEQERIVAILDEAFEGIATATAHAERNLHNARELFQSVLQSTFQQKGEDWVETTLGDACKMYQPKTISKKDLIADGPYSVFGANGIIGQYDQFNHDEPQVLVTCRGATCGAVNVSDPFSWITGNAMVVRPLDSNLDLRFLEYALRGGVDLSPAITGAAQPQITRTNLNPIPFGYPQALATQKAIVQKLDALATETRRLEAIYQRKLAALAELKQSLLQRAFAGQL